MKLLRTNQSGTQELSQMISRVTWSGDIQACSRCLEFDLVSMPGVELPEAPVELGDRMAFYEDNQLFDGFVFSIQTGTNDRTKTVRCYDRGIYLNNCQGYYRFQNTTPEAVAQKLAEEFGFSLGEIAATGHRFSRNFLGQSLYKILATAYTMASASTGDRYRIAFELDKLTVRKKQQDQETMEAIFPLVKKYGAAVVGLTLDKKGIPKTTQARMDIARRILDTALSYGIRREDVYIDCLTLTVSAEQEGAAQTLEALRRVHSELGLKTVLGVSNISFGLPARPLINQNFLTMAMTCGLDLPIINPNMGEMMAAVCSYHLLMNIDKEAREFIAAYGGATISTSITAGAGQQAAAPGAGERSLSQIVEAGLRGEAGECTRKLLETTDPMAIVDDILIPALDKVGADFETGKVFLPQLIQSAGAAQAAFEVIRQTMPAQAEGTEKAPIVLATVKGDIHDIGKNIVKVLLENYGYPVIDLGKDVDPEEVVRAAEKYQAPLVGLSALMTTTLHSMEQTIALLRKANLNCKVVVGGAVLTAEYAKQIGADFYAKDAKQSVDVARQVIG